MKLSIIILNWNAASDTIRCIRDIAGWELLQPTIWVVDNGSTDGSADLIVKQWPEVNVIRNPVNLGYAAGNNQGIVQALARGDAPILLLNNDAFVAEVDVIRLLETLEVHTHLGFVGPLIYDADQRDRLLGAGGRNIAYHILTHIAEVPVNVSVYGVDYVPGTVILGRAEIFRKIGLLDEDYFFTGEIPDICWRAKQGGYLTAIDTRTKAFHALNHASRMRETLYPYYIVRNRFLFIRKFYPRLKFLLYGFWGFYSVALSVKVQLTGKLSSAQAIRLGLWDGLRGQFGGQNERVWAVCSTSSSA